MKVWILKDLKPGWNAPVSIWVGDICGADRFEEVVPRAEVERVRKAFQNSEDAKIQMLRDLLGRACMALDSHHMATGTPVCPDCLVMAEKIRAVV